VRLHIVRHGETEWHAENRYAGSSDVPLTPKGKQQATALIPWALEANLSTVASSDLSRARDTAMPIAEALGMAVLESSALREVDFGKCEGLSTEEMRAQFPIAREQFERSPATNPLPGAETGLAAIERALPAVAGILAQSNGDDVLLVIHSTLGRLLVCEMLGIDPNRYRRLFPVFVNGAVTTVQFDAVTSADSLRGQGALLCLNQAVWK
jgi:probable phosphoglycerate mutase